MVLAPAAAVTLPTIGALGAIAYYSKYPNEPGKEQKQRRRNSFFSTENNRNLVVEDDPTEFSSFSSVPSIIDNRRIARRNSMPVAALKDMSIEPDKSLLVEPHLQIWRDRYKWGRKYGVNFAHNNK